jgi:hypothetical protein
VDGIQHISTRIKLRFSKRDYDESCLLEDINLYHYRYEKSNMTDTNYFVITNVHAFNIRVLHVFTQILKLFFIIDKPVMETNCDVRRDETVVDADQGSEGHVGGPGHQAEGPLRVSDGSMYLLYIWSPSRVLYFSPGYFHRCFLLISIFSPSSSSTPPPISSSYAQ